MRLRIAEADEQRIADRPEHLVYESIKPGPGGSAPARGPPLWELPVPDQAGDPMAPLKGLNLATLQDGDPRAMAALKNIREASDNAPIESNLDGTRIRIAGFAVPLDKTDNMTREFLLVPYFGACIHTPPPPLNQVIHVRASKPVVRVRMMDAFWVSGVVSAARVGTHMGDAGYRIDAESVAPYR